MSQHDAIAKSIADAIGALGDVQGVSVELHFNVVVNEAAKEPLEHETWHDKTPVTPAMIVKHLGYTRTHVEKLPINWTLKGKKGRYAIWKDVDSVLKAERTKAHNPANGTRLSVATASAKSSLDQSMQVGEKATSLLS